MRGVLFYRFWGGETLGTAPQNALSDMEHKLVSEDRRSDSGFLSGDKNFTHQTAKLRGTHAVAGSPLPG